MLPTQKEPSAKVSGTSRCSSRNGSMSRFGQSSSIISFLSSYLSSQAATRSQSQSTLFSASLISPPRLCDSPTGSGLSASDSAKRGKLQAEKESNNALEYTAVLKA